MRKDDAIENVHTMYLQLESESFLCEIIKLTFGRVQVDEWKKRYQGPRSAGVH